jgi:hypothetical protein
MCVPVPVPNADSAVGGFPFNDLSHWIASPMLVAGTYTYVLTKRLTPRSAALTKNAIPHILPGLRQADANRLRLLFVVKAGVVSPSCAPDLATDGGLKSEAISVA